MSIKTMPKMFNWECLWKRNKGWLNPCINSTAAPMRPDTPHSQQMNPDQHSNLLICVNAASILALFWPADRSSAKGSFGPPKQWHIPGCPSGWQTQTTAMETSWHHSQGVTKSSCLSQSEEEMRSERRKRSFPILLRGVGGSMMAYYHKHKTSCKYKSLFLESHFAFHQVQTCWKRSQTNLSHSSSLPDEKAAFRRWLTANHGFSCSNIRWHLNPRWHQSLNNNDLCTHHSLSSYEAKYYPKGLGDVVQEDLQGRSSSHCSIGSEQCMGLLCKTQTHTESQKQCSLCQNHATARQHRGITANGLSHIRLQLSKWKRQK